MLLTPTFLYSQGDLGKTMEEINAGLKFYGIPPAVQGISEDPNVWVLEMGGFGVARYYLDPELGLTTKFMTTFDKKKDWKEQKRNINRLEYWQVTYQDKTYKQWMTISNEGYIIYANAYKECLVIEYLIDIKENE